MPARPLFVAGCPRSGTTAVADYLNQHPAVLVCRERYKHLPSERISPELFTFNRILDYHRGETNTPPEYHEELLEEKDPSELRWAGDKNPMYFRHLHTLLDNNPGARFILTYRPAVDVAESFENRARREWDPWPEQAGFEEGIRRWNLYLGYLREFLESGREPEVLIVSYDDLYDRNAECYALISSFLDLPEDETVRNSWLEIRHSLEHLREPKDLLTEEQKEFVEANKDHEAEKWVLEFIRRQEHGPVKLPRSERVDRRVHEDRIRELEDRLRRERRKSQQSRRESRYPNEQSQDLDSRSRTFLERLTRLKASLFGKST